MKSIIVCVAVAALVSVGATIVIPAAGAQAASSDQGRVLFQRDVSKFGVARGPLDGAPAADSIGFRINDAVQGGALIVGLDQPVLGVFVGINPPAEFINAPYNDLHVTFTLADGTTRSVKPAGGSSLAMLFQSPEDVPMADLRQVALSVDNAAEWAK